MQQFSYNFDNCAIIALETYVDLMKNKINKKKVSNKL